MKDDVYLITGGTSGVGLSIVKGIGDHGGRMLFVGRNRERGESIEKQLQSSTGNPNMEFLPADLSDLEDIRRLVREVERKTDRLNVLSYNAGVLSLERQVTAQGNELTFAVNYLGFYVLSILLSPLLIASAPSRILSVSGNPGALERITLNLRDLQMEHNYNGFVATLRAALAKVLFTFELSRSLGGTGVTANTYHPGLVRGGLGSHLPVYLKPFFSVANIFFRRASKTGLYAALSEELKDVSGAFLARSRTVPFENRKHSREDIERLIEISAELTGIHPG